MLWAVWLPFVIEKPSVHVPLEMACQRLDLIQIADVQVAHHPHQFQLDPEGLPQLLGDEDQALRVLRGSPSAGTWPRRRSQPWPSRIGRAGRPSLPPSTLDPTAVRHRTRRSRA